MRDLARWKLIAFALLATGLALAAVEGGARLVERSGVETRPVDDRIHRGSHDLRAHDGAFTLPGGERVPRTSPGWRLVLAGASFTAGTPYTGERGGAPVFGGIGSWLQEYLRGLHPDRPTAIINLGDGGVASHRVADVVEAVAPLPADALFVATCNNEGVLPPGRMATVIRRSTAAGLLQRVLAAPPESERPYFVPQDADTEAVKANFEASLRRIVAAARQADRPLLLATLPVNLRYAGFEPGPSLEGQVSQTPGGACAEAVVALREGRLEAGIDGLERCDGLQDIAAWRGLALLRLGRFAEGRAQLAGHWGACTALGVESHFRGDHEAAIAQLRTCEDPTEALRWIGLATFSAGRSAEARRLLEQSVELMPRNRCRPTFNAIIREVAASDGVTLVDLERVAQEASPGGVPGPELFVDFCHLNWRGYSLMAAEILRVLDEVAPPPWPPTGEVPDMAAIRRTHGLL